MNLQDYLQFFKDAIDNNHSGVWISNEGQVPFVQYHETVSQFIKDFYMSDYLDTNYMANYNLIQAREIDTLSCDQLKTVLTYIIRQERFSEGVLLRSIQSGKMYTIVSNLHQK